MSEVPLKGGKKASHHAMSAFMSAETGSRTRVDGKAGRLFNKRDMKMWPGLTQAVTKESFPRRDCNCLKV